MPHANMPRMRVTAIAVNRHVFDGQLNGRPLRLRLTFDGGQTLRLRVAGDGCTMIVDDLPLDEPFDLDKYGSVIVEDVTQSLFGRLQTGDVKEARALQLGDAQVGVRLLLVSGDAFDFWVDGDELCWGDEGALAAHDWLDGLV